MCIPFKTRFHLVSDFRSTIIDSVPRGRHSKSEAPGVAVPKSDNGIHTSVRVLQSGFGRWVRKLFRQQLDPVVVSNGLGFALGI